MGLAAEDQWMKGTSILHIALNTLAWEQINPPDHIPSETMEQAVDRLSLWVRRGSLGVMLGLLDIAAAIRDHRGFDPEA